MKTVRITAVGLLGVDEAKYVSYIEERRKHYVNTTSSPYEETLEKSPNNSFVISARILDQNDGRKRHSRGNNGTPVRSNRRDQKRANDCKTSDQVSKSCESKPLRIYNFSVPSGDKSDGQDKEVNVYGASWAQSRIVTGARRTSIMFLEYNNDHRNENIEIEISAALSPADEKIGQTVFNIFPSKDDAFRNEGARVMDLLLEPVEHMQCSECSNNELLPSTKDGEVASPSRSIKSIFGRSKKSSPSRKFSPNNEQLTGNLLAQNAFVRVMVEVYNKNSPVDTLWFDRITLVSKMQESGVLVVKNAGIETGGCNRNLLDDDYSAGTLSESNDSLNENIMNDAMTQFTLQTRFTVNTESESSYPTSPSHVAHVRDDFEENVNEDDEESYSNSERDEVIRVGCGAAELICHVPKDDNDIPQHDVVYLSDDYNRRGTWNKQLREYQRNDGAPSYHYDEVVPDEAVVIGKENVRGIDFNGSRSFSETDAKSNNIPITISPVMTRIPKSPEFEKEIPHILPTQYSENANELETSTECGRQFELENESLFRPYSESQHGVEEDSLPQRSFFFSLLACGNDGVFDDIVTCAGKQTYKRSSRSELLIFDDLHINEGDPLSTTQSRK